MARKNRKIILLSDDGVANEHYGFTQDLAEIFRKAGVDTSTKEPGVFVSGAMTKQIVKAMHDMGYRLALVGESDVEMKPPAPEQGNTATVTKKAYGIGDVLESGPQKGWLIVKFNNNGSVKLLEPEATAPKGVVKWQKGIDHAAALREQGHLTARLWTKQDGDDIIANIVEGGHNDKAKLDLSGSRPGGRYWEKDTDRGWKDAPGLAMARYPAGGDRVYTSKCPSGKFLNQKNHL